jgi:hypothetical protein
MPDTSIGDYVSPVKEIDRMLAAKARHDDLFKRGLLTYSYNPTIPHVKEARPVRPGKIEYPKVKLEAQGSLLSLSVDWKTKDRRVAGGVRGDVLTFSRQSRLRLLRKIARVNADKAVFVTLTYPARFPSSKRAKEHLRAFLEKIRRRYPAASAIWKLERQSRGAPHFHLLFFNLPFIPFSMLRRWWAHTIAAFVDEHLPRVRIERVRSQNGVMYYAAKYCAKADAGGGVNLSLSTAHICTLLMMTAPGSSVWSRAFAFRMYLALVASLRDGRVWGVFNRDAVPYHPHHVIELEQLTDVAFKQAKRYAGLLRDKINPDGPYGFAIFTQDTKSHWDRLLHILMDDFPMAHGYAVYGRWKDRGGVGAAPERCRIGAVAIRRRSLSRHRFTSV